MSSNTYVSFGSSNVCFIASCFCVELVTISAYTSAFVIVVK